MLTVKRLRNAILVLTLTLVASPPPSVVHGQTSPDADRQISTEPWIAVPVPEDTGLLPAGTITALWADDGQAVWVGTGSGLYRYDGGDRHAFKSEKALGGCVVWALCADGAGGLWAGTERGLLHFDGSVWKSLAEGPASIDAFVTALAADGNRGVWIGALRRLMHFDAQTVDIEVCEDDGKPLGSATAVIPVEEGEAFFAAGNEVILLSRKSPPLHFPITAGTHGSGERVQALALAADGTVWAGTDAGLYRLAAGALERVISAEDIDGLDTLDVRALAMDGAEGLWLGTQNGLFHFDGHELDLRPAAAARGYQPDRVDVIHRARDGTLWLGTDGHIVRWRPAAWQFFPAAGSGIRAIAGVGEHLWATSASEGLVSWDGQAWTPLAETNAYGLWVEGEDVWFGSSGGLRHLRSARGMLTDPEQLADLEATVFARDAVGNLWIGTTQGLYQMRDGLFVGDFHKSDGLAGEFVYALMADKGTVWVGSQGGLTLGDGKHWEAIAWDDGSTDNTVRALARAPDGTVWAGTNNGLWRLSAGRDAREAAAWQRYNIADASGVSAESDLWNTVNALWVDGEGLLLWIGTDAGLAGLDDNRTAHIQEDDVWVLLKTDDGLPDQRVTALWRDDKGFLWVGTDTGIARHVPSRQVPQIKSVSIGTKTVWQGGELLAPMLNWKETSVGIDFGGTTFAWDPSGLVYRYRLTDVTGDYDPSKTRTRVLPKDGALAHLETGARYKLVIQAFDKDLNASPTIDFDFSVQAVPLERRPEVWVAVVMVAIAVAAVLAAVASGRAGRWWRNRDRPSFRESWSLSFSQANTQWPIVTVETRQRYARDLRLIAEGKISRFLNPNVNPATETVGLPDELHPLYAAWLEAVEPFGSVSAEDSARLGAAFLPDVLVSALRSISERTKYHVRLRLDFARAPALAALPWEMVELPGVGRVGIEPSIAVSRWIPKAVEIDTGVKPDAASERPATLQALPRRHAPNILLVVASPRMPPKYLQLERLDVTKEHAQLEEALRGRPANTRVLAGVHAGGPETHFNMVQALEGELVDRAAGPPDVVHFIGHAAPHPDPKKRDGIELYLEDAKGLFYPLAAPGLAKMIAESQALVDGPRLVVLNACQTAQVDGSQTLVGLVPELVTRTGVMAVIGMQFKVGDDAAATFSAVLYSQLLDTQPLDYAVARARSAMSEYGGHDWAAPVLYMQVADGMIYEP